MPEDPVTDDQSHYEISLTAGQAFIAFVLLLLSLAASFAFGLLIGKGQGDDRLVVKKEPAVVTEASMLPKKNDSGRIVELGVANDDFKTPVKSDATATATTTATETPVVVPAATTVTTPTTTAPAAAPPAPVTPAAAPAMSGPVYAQLLSTGDQKTAEGLAVRLINGGFTSALVERGTTEKGTIFRVRVRFNSDADARAAEPKLREYSKDVWITK